MEEELLKLKELEDENEKCVIRVMNAIEDFERLASVAIMTLKEELIRLMTEEEDSGDRTQRFQAQLQRLKELQGITKELISPTGTSTWGEKQEQPGSLALDI